MNAKLLATLSKFYPGVMFCIGEVSDQLTGLSHTVSKLSYQDGMCRVILAEGYASAEGDEARAVAFAAMMQELRQVLSFAEKEAEAA